MADFGGSELDAFRAEARAWLDENYPKSLRKDLGAQNEEQAMTAMLNPNEDQKLWKQRMAEKGWGAPTWPTKYGGGGLTQPQARVLQDEMARIGASNPMMGMGTSMFGPTLLEYG